MFNNDIGIIIWKKTDKYRCIVNNCNIELNTELDSYLKHIIYADYYHKIILTQEDQIINNLCKNNNDGKIILKYIPDDTIMELRIHVNINIQLLSSLSHKIRNPLSNIYGMLTFLDNNKMGKNEKENMKILKKSCYDIIGVMNDIIDIVNFNCGELKLNTEIINLNNLLTECYQIMAKGIEDKKLILKIVINDDVPKKIIVDKIKLKQIIINMLTNSLQHTDIGSIIINVSLFKNDPECPFNYNDAEKPKYNIKFSIKDSGRGMDTTRKEIVEKILGINDNINNNYIYTGLGLIISKYMCNLMGGNIWFKTDINIGTVFHFNIIVNGIE